MPAFPSNTLITEFFGLITGDTPHLALYTSNPTAADVGTEVTGGSYARQPITFGSITSATISNTGALTFTSLPTANITHWGIRDALTSGSLKAFGAFPATIAAVSGDDVIIPIGQIDLTFAGS